MQLEELKTFLRELGIAEEQLDVIAQDLAYDILARSIQSLMANSPELPAIQEGLRTGNFPESAQKVLATITEDMMVKASVEQSKAVLRDFIEEMKSQMEPAEVEEFNKKLTKLANQNVIGSLQGSDSKSILQSLSN